MGAGTRPWRPPAGAVDSTATAHPWFEPVSWFPRAFVAHGFASKEETDHMIKLAQPQVRAVSACDLQAGSNVAACHFL